jgi:hypothetical protein
MLRSDPLGSLLIQVSRPGTKPIVTPLPLALEKEPLLLGYLAKALHSYMFFAYFIHNLLVY